MKAEELRSLRDRLLDARCRPADIPIVDRPGLYALFLNDPIAIAGLAVGRSGLLYVGQSEFKP